MIGKNKIKAGSDEPGKGQTLHLAENDVAIVLRADGRSETICTLQGKHELTLQEEVIIGLGGLLQNPKFVESIRTYFFDTMQKMLNSKA